MGDPAPTGPACRAEDTRLEAFKPDEGEFLFASPDSGAAQIEAVLLYRRAYKRLMGVKGWSDPDIVMESASATVF
jgi:hypothetical protein